MFEIYYQRFLTCKFGWNWCFHCFSFWGRKLVGSHSITFGQQREMHHEKLWSNWQCKNKSANLSGWDPFGQLGPFWPAGALLCEFACSPCACMGFVWLPPTILRHACLVNWSFYIGHRVECEHEIGFDFCQYSIIRTDVLFLFFFLFRHVTNISK